MVETGENDNKQSQVNDNNCDNVSNEVVYHAVYVPKDVEDNFEGTIHVYTDKTEALAVIKSSRTGRLKTFKSRSEAERYAEYGFEEITTTNRFPKVQVANAEEKGSSFKAPKSQELVIFRKLIEDEDLDAVMKKVWENPRYLISSGDTPAILQEGCRYNALHIASFKTEDARMCEKLLETVSDPKFVELLYGKGCKTTYETTAKILLDLYLNTPDKGLNETPLHFASKHGKIEVVKLLLSYPQCLKTVKNKYGQTPIQVVCTRKGQENENLSRDIKMLFEDQYYVPVWRAEDNTLQPTIGMPFCPLSPPRIQIDPLSPKVEVKAVAGPMTKSQAVEFRRKWKTPPRMLKTPTKTTSDHHNESFKFLSPRSRDPGVRLQDTEKGLETVGRDLAQEYHVNWSEWWGFLNDCADLRCIEGLSKLEKYFRNRCTGIKGQSCSRTKLLQDKVDKKEEKITKYSGKGRKLLLGDHGDDGDVGKEMDDMEMLIKQLEMCSINGSMSTDSDTDDVFVTPPETPGDSDDDDGDSENEYSLAEEDNPVYDQLFIDGDLPGKNDLDVMNAIPECIDAEIFPLIYRWKHEVLLAMKRNQVVICTPRRRLLLTPLK